MVDFPTPPFPLVIATILVGESGPNCTPRFEPCRRSVSAVRSATVMTETLTGTSVTSGTEAAALRTSLSMRSAAGHPTIVSFTPIVAWPSSNST